MMMVGFESRSEPVRARKMSWVWPILILSSLELGAHDSLVFARVNS